LSSNKPLPGDRAVASVLVTGGTGTLGRLVVACLALQHYRVRIMSRQEPALQTGAPPRAGWARADLESVEGLEQALSGVDVIVHAASNPLDVSGNVDVSGTERLLSFARDARVAHIVYISIVGIDRASAPYLPAQAGCRAASRAVGRPMDHIARHAILQLARPYCLRRCAGAPGLQGGRPALPAHRRRRSGGPPLRRLGCRPIGTRAGYRRPGYSHPSRIGPDPAGNTGPEPGSPAGGFCLRSWRATGKRLSDYSEQQIW